MPQAKSRRSSSRKKTARRSPRSRSTRRASSRKPDALRMLKDDHQRVQTLFERFERARGADQKEKLAETICGELTVHAQLEEEIFYPAVREAIDDDDLMNEAEVEHTSAKELIAQIEASSPSDDKYDAMVTVLGEYVRHHVKEEEQEMFKKVRQTDLDLAELAQRLKERKESLQGGPASRLVGRLKTMGGAQAGA